MNPRILVAGIGNIFLGDDGFGVEVTRRLTERTLPDGVEVVDYGIRGMDLAYALLEDREALIFVDVVQRGEKPGTLYLIEHSIDPQGGAVIETHGMDPVKVLALAQTLGARPTRTYIVACEPELLVPAENNEDVVVALSAPVQAAVNEAVHMVEALVRDILSLNSVT